MKRAFIIHGWSGNPNGEWIPWLKENLEKKGYEVFAPEMPHTDEPKIKEWVDKLSDIVGTPSENDYFVGHSIGCQAILRYLETISGKVGGAVFVAGWFNLENLEGEDIDVADEWINTEIDLEKVTKVLPKSTLIISNNDPFGALESNKQKFEELGSKIIVMQNAGHLTAEDGYTELPVVLEELEKMK